MFDAVLNLRFVHVCAYGVHVRWYHKHSFKFHLVGPKDTLNLVVEELRCFLSYVWMQTLTVLLVHHRGS